MATIVLDYDNNNIQVQRVLKKIISLGFFKERYIKLKRKSVPIRKDTAFSYTVIEQMLAKDWLSKEEEEAWKDL